MPDIGGEQLRQAQKLRKLSEEITASTENLEKEEYDFYQNKYQIDSYKEIPFCVVIPTFNNAAQNRYLRNINSVVYQNYSNFHIVVIDDGSYDQTGELIIDFLQKQLAVPKERYTVIKNQKQMKAMHNLRTAALNHCAPEEIFLIVDGDDELIGRQVLKLFNAYFQITQAWFVYSNFLLRWIEPGFSRPFPERVIKSNAYRSYPFVTSHLRAFYTALFRNIR
jgi:glycosyltransferase involved in cell wall biosynthesis